jgi:hypothetical protein
VSVSAGLQLGLDKAAEMLRRRAESYGRDASILRCNGSTDDALVYEAIRDELRAVAGYVELLLKDSA